MKGLDLTISAIILIILALVVLAAGATFFFGVFNPTYAGTNLETAKNAACQTLAGMGCTPNTWTIDVRNFDADKDSGFDSGSGHDATTACGGAPLNDNLFMLCRCYYGISGSETEIDSNCKKTVCGCGMNL